MVPNTPLAIFKSQHLIQFGIFGSEKNLLMDGMICGDLLHTNFLTAHYEHFLPSSKLSSTPAVLCSLVNLIAYSNLDMLNYCGDFFPFSFLWKFFCAVQLTSKMNPCRCSVVSSKNYKTFDKSLVTQCRCLVSFIRRTRVQIPPYPLVVTIK